MYNSHGWGQLHYKYRFHTNSTSKIPTPKYLLHIEIWYEQSNQTYTSPKITSIFEPLYLISAYIHINIYIYHGTQLKTNLIYATYYI